MTFLIRRAVIVSPSSAFHFQTVDILIEDGIVTQIKPQISVDGNTRILDIPGLHVSNGWVDILADFGEPGYEYRETITSGSLAAASGGYTDVLISPETTPSLSSRSLITFIKEKSAAVRLHPIATVSKEAEGKELAEMYDMYKAGAVAFSDGFHPIQHSGVLLKALQYVVAINAPVIQVPGDKSIGKTGLMNEGITSTQLGLPGLPALSEELMIARDIELLKYTKSKLHITGISTRKGLAMIRAAKEQGLHITCSVTPYHLYFCDEDLKDYDTNLKVYPPLRTSSDRDALIEGIKQGWIDAISSHHRPAHIDEKECEFEYARFGMAGIQTAFATALKVIKDINIVVQKFTSARTIFSLPQAEIAENLPACLTLFNPNENFIFTLEQNRSLSSNNAFTGRNLQGKVYGTIIQNKIFLNP